MLSHQNLKKVKVWNIALLKWKSSSERQRYVDQEKSQISLQLVFTLKLAHFHFYTFSSTLYLSHFHSHTLSFTLPHFIFKTLTHRQRLVDQGKSRMTLLLIHLTIADLIVILFQVSFLFLHLCSASFLKINGKFINTMECTIFSIIFYNHWSNNGILKSSTKHWCQQWFYNGF